MKPTREELERKYSELEPINTFRNTAIDLAVWAMEQVEPKAIGFDEWKKKNQDDSWREGDGSFACRVWNAAQSSLIASGQYIRVPPVEEWPDDKNIRGIGLRFTICSESEWIDKDGVDFAYISRPATSAWRPKEGEWVWWESRDEMLCGKWYEDSFSQIKFIAAQENFEQEKTWTREQFRQRGRFWESGK